LRIYTFYFCRADGAAPSFEVYALTDDEAAGTSARRLLDEHPSCSHVMVCQDEREVLTLRRVFADA
jgi:hypothetical protein